jgi:hypothetical protein
MWTMLQSFRVRDAVDILVVAIVLYRVFVMFKETRAVQMLLGLGGLMMASFLARRFELYGTSWLLENFWSFWVLALIVLFQPELRRALAQIGQSRFFQGMALPVREERGHVLDDVVKAADALAAKRIGALMVLERGISLRNYSELGVPLDAMVSADLLVTLGTVCLASLVAYGAISRHRGASRRAQCLGNVKQITHAVIQYANEHEQTFPALAPNSNQRHTSRPEHAGHVFEGRDPWECLRHAAHDQQPRVRTRRLGG